MTKEGIAYWAFFISLALAVAVGPVLPGILKLTQEAAEEWVLLGLLPVMLGVAWALWTGTAAQTQAPDVPTKGIPLPRQP